MIGFVLGCFVGGLTVFVLYAAIIVGTRDE